MAVDVSFVLFMHISHNELDRFNSVRPYGCLFEFAEYIVDQGTIYEDPGSACGGLSVQRKALQAIKCGERGNGFICQMPGIYKYK